MKQSTDSKSILQKIFNLQRIFNISAKTWASQMQGNLAKAHEFTHFYFQTLWWNRPLKTAIEFKLPCLEDNCAKRGLQSNALTLNVNFYGDRYWSSIICSFAKILSLIWGLHSKYCQISVVASNHISSTWKWCSTVSCPWNSRRWAKENSLANQTVQSITSYWKS